MIKEKIEKILEYLYEDEKKHYEESDKESQENHIFLDIKEVSEWLESPSCPLVDDEELELEE